MEKADSVMTSGSSCPAVLSAWLLCVLVSGTPGTTLQKNVCVRGRISLSKLPLGTNVCVRVCVCPMDVYAPLDS